jgi:hypothetical protein
MAILPLRSLPAAGLPASSPAPVGGGLQAPSGPREARPHPQLPTRTASAGGGGIAPRMALARLRGTAGAASAAAPALEADAARAVRQQIGTGQILLHAPHREANLDNALAVAVRGLASLHRDFAGR